MASRLGGFIWPCHSAWPDRRPGSSLPSGERGIPETRHIETSSGSEWRIFALQSRKALPRTSNASGSGNPQRVSSGHLLAPSWLPTGASDALNDRGGRHSVADALSLQAEARAVTMNLIDKLGHEYSPSGPQRVSVGNGASIWVDAVKVGVELLLPSKDH